MHFIVIAAVQCFVLLFVLISSINSATEVISVFHELFFHASAQASALRIYPEAAF